MRETSAFLPNKEIREISAETITNEVAKLCVKANIHLGSDVKSALQTAKNAETSALAISTIGTILQNAEIAERENMPICQDTGMTVVFVEIGENVHINGNITAAINAGVRKGYKDGYFRASVVSNPINRQNTQDNTPAIIHYDFVDGENLAITVAPKGFGSENMSALKMLNPSDGLAGVEDFVVETVKNAGANPCPPIIVGVGLGGTMEKAALLAKRALLRDLSQPNASPEWSQVEERLLSKINALNIGASGYGGKTTALAVHILPFATHIAGLPVAVNINCHAARHRTVIL